MKKVKTKKEKDNICNKINEIKETIAYNPNHYKNLKYPYNNFKRVHVNNSFVILFDINETDKTITFWDYDHHDKIYKKIKI